MLPLRMHTFFVVLKGKNRADKPDGITAFVNDRCSLEPGAQSVLTSSMSGRAPPFFCFANSARRFTMPAEK